MTTWDSAQYLRFADERSRPCRDLARSIALAAPRRVADLGCGPGNSTAVLAEQWPQAELTGVDSSPDMLARARRDHPEIRWEDGDIGAWRPEQPYDLVFSNAALHWVPDHAALFPRLLGHVMEGGALAVQMPGNQDALPHRLMRELAASAAWKDSFPGPVREWYAHDLPAYYDILSGHASRVDLWATEYQHVLAGAAAIAEWYKGSGLRPFLDMLPDAERRDRFVADYTARLAETHPPRRDGKVLFPFRRLFIVAYR